MSKPNLANVDTLDKMCPSCNGDMLLLMDEYVCSVCGLRLNRWFDPNRPLVERAREFHMKLRKRIEECEGGKGSEPPDFPSSSIATHGEGSSGPPKPLPKTIFDVPPEETELKDGKVWWKPRRLISDKRPPMKQGAEYPAEEATKHLFGEVLEDPDKEGCCLPSPTECVPGPLAPFILAEHDLRRLMKEDCSPDDGLGEQRYLERPTSSSPFPSWPIGYPPETQQKLCKFYDVGTHICKEDDTAWCLNPAAPICWTRIDGERVKKEWPLYKGSQWKNNSECPVCGAKVDYEIASCETGCNYCCDAHATQDVKELTPEGGW